MEDIWIKNHQAKVTPEKEVSQQRLWLPHPPCGWFCGEEVWWDLISKPALTGSTVPKAPIKKRKVALWLAQGTGCQMWHLGCSFHDSQRMKSYYLRLEWETAQDSLLQGSGPYLPRCLSNLCRVMPALMWTPVCSQLCTCSQLPPVGCLGGALSDSGLPSRRVFSG